jgi:hypothetical protein
MLKAVLEGVDIPGFGKYGPHPIMVEVYKNHEFRKSFLDWYLYHRDREFHPDTMNLLLDEMAAELRPYMAEYAHRWPFIGAIRGDWETSLEGIREYNLARPEYMDDHILQWLNTDKISAVKYALLQNSPNPFNFSTNIKYQIPGAGTVNLKIFNTLGQLIRSYSMKHNSGGHYSQEWNAGNQSPGVYFISMEIDGFYDVKKMLYSGGY